MISDVNIPHFCLPEKPYDLSTSEENIPHFWLLKNTHTMLLASGKNRTRRFGVSRQSPVTMYQTTISTKQRQTKIRANNKHKTPKKEVLLAQYLHSHAPKLQPTKPQKARLRKGR